MTAAPKQILGKSTTKVALQLWISFQYTCHSDWQKYPHNML